jgi:hypothetical protein
MQEKPDERFCYLHMDDIIVIVIIIELLLCCEVCTLNRLEISVHRRSRGPADFTRSAVHHRRSPAAQYACLRFG